MNLIRLCIARPVGVSVGVLLVLLFGLLSLFAIPVQLTPNVDVPVITVKTNWRGANPQEVEREIIDRQEETLRSVKSLRQMTSSARDNAAEIKLEFYPGVDKSEALRDVSDKLRQVTGYPLEVDEPTVEASDPAINSPIAWLILYPPPGEQSDDIRKLRDFAEDYVKPYLDRVDGVASIGVLGGLEREMQVRVDAGELAARGLTFRQVSSALRRQNENVSAGTRSQGKRDYAIRTVGRYTSEDEIRNTVIAYTDGGPVYIRDVADVEFTFAKPTSFVRSKAQYVLAFPVRREVGTNVMQIMADVNEAIARVNTEVLEARKMRLELTQVYDETTYITQSVRMVQTNIIFGGALAVVVLMLFLRNWRATLVVALAIPIAVIATFMMLYAFGRTLNVISLAGMAFAVGMVVDNAVVVLENIYRHRQMGKGAFAAAHDGTREVWGAVLAATLTTMAVFIPIVFVTEEAGQLFADISIATATAVGLSLIVAVTVIPTLSARLLTQARAAPDSTDKPRGDRARIPTFAAAFVGRINEWPALVRLLLIACMSLGSLLLAWFLIPDRTYLPSGNRNLVFGFLYTPPGYSLDEFQRMALTIESDIEPYWRVAPDSPEKAELDRKWREMIDARIAANEIRELNNPKLTWLERARTEREWRTPPPCINNFFFVSFGGGCFMGCSSRDDRRVKPLARLLEVSGQRIPGVFPMFNQTQLFRFGSGNTAEIQIRGDDLEKVNAAALAVQMACMRDLGRPQPSPPNFALGRPEVRIIPDRERAADLGLDVADVGLIVEACVDGAYVGEYRVAGGDTVDISLYVQDQEGKPTADIGQVPIYAPVGQIVPLSAVVRLVDTTAQEQINHIERQRAVTLTVTPPEAMALETVISQIEDEMVPALRDADKIDDSVLVSLTGNADKLRKATATMVGEWAGWNVQSLINLLGSRFFLSILIVYLLMAALFESWIYPFVIMFSIPLAIAGGFFGLWLAHNLTLMTTDQPVQQFDLLTFLGFVILVGVVVNNAILLVDQSLRNMRSGQMDGHAAIREAVRVRVRPVFMTSLTTFFGQLPLALMPGAGSELYRGLASVMLGGLLVATIGTLILVPTVLGVLHDLRTWAVRRRGASPDRELAAQREGAAAVRAASPSNARVFRS